MHPKAETRLFVIIRCTHGSLAATSYEAFCIEQDALRQARIQRGFQRLREELKVTISVYFINTIRKEIDVQTLIAPVRNSADEAIFSGVGNNAHALLPVEIVFFERVNQAECLLMYLAKINSFTAPVLAELPVQGGIIPRACPLGVREQLLESPATGPGPL